MSLGFELAQSGSANQYANAFGDTKPADQLAPAMFEGVGTAIGSGIMRGGAAAARAVSLAAGVLPVLQDKLTGGTERSDIYFERHDRIFNRATEYWTPRPDEVGAAGRILGGAAEMTLPLMATGGNPTLLMGSAGLGGAEDLVRQGVDATAARAVGTVQAAAVGLGFKIPFVGRNLMERVAAGAASNFAVGMGAAAASAGQLSKEGYAAQAKQFDPFDVEARAVDVLMGAVFGGVAHLGARAGLAKTRDSSILAKIPADSPLAAALNAMPDSARDALLTANNVLHADVETAPGRPRTLDAQNDHADALSQAMDELDAGEPVTAQIDPAAFDANPTQDAFRDAIVQAADDVRGKPLSPEPLDLATVVVAARDRDTGEVLYGKRGQTHIAFVDAAGGRRLEMGFAEPGGKFLTRDEAAAFVDGKGAIDGELDAAAYAQALKEDTTAAPVSDLVPSRESDSGAKPSEVPPEIAAAEHAVAVNPDLHIPIEDGTVMRADDALAKADEVIAQAQTESKAFDAAVSCLLRG